jgi:DNA-binding NarL/FixJ family response regulator
MTTVMVVDDSSTIRAMVTELLRQNGYEVMEAGDGVEAQSIMKDKRPDLVITPWGKCPRHFMLDKRGSIRPPLGHEAGWRCLHH